MAMMTEEHKRLLKVNHFNILERIVDVDAVLDHLFQMEIISKDTLERINLKQTIKDKARALMLQLARLSEEAYHAFLLALLRTNQIELARLFDPNYEGPDTVDKDASEISLIETFKFEDLQTEMMSDAEVYMHINDKRNYKLPFLERNSDMIYGRVLIINNIEFDILDRRTGSENDSLLLKNCFERLRFLVECHENKRCVEMEGILRKECDNFNTFSQQHNNSNFTYNNNNINNDNDVNNDVNNDQNISLDYTDSSGDVINIDSYRNTSIFILVIISHGAKNHIYGTDGYGDKNLISIETIQGIFSSTSCPALAYKPKLFFIQACQRDSVRPSYPSHEATNNVNWRAPKLNPEVKVGNSKDYLHPLSDMFLMMSTVLGDLSWRDPVMGSYFIRTIVYIITTKSHKTNLSGMMTMAKRLLSNKPIETDQGKVIQQPEVRSTLNKELWFLC